MSDHLELSTTKPAVWLRQSALGGPFSACYALVFILRDRPGSRRGSVHTVSLPGQQVPNQLNFTAPIDAPPRMRDLRKAGAK